MALMFEEEARFPDNRQRANFVFVGFPYASPLPLDDYRSVLTSLEAELPLRFWYFLVEYTTDELMRKLWRGVLRADLCIFDISGGNPNVSFEIGLAVATFKRCSTILRQGAENPLGRADLAYAERAEYSSAATMKETLKRVLGSKSSAMRTVREVSNFLFNSSRPLTVDQIQAHVTAILNEVFQRGHITKTRAEQLVGNRPLADEAMKLLRERGIVSIEGAKRGAKYVFTDGWVYRNHEVAGIA